MNGDDPTNVAALKARAAWISVGSNTLLISTKLLVGLSIGSVAIISEAVHSGMDLLAAGMALYAVRKASEPPDRAHSYGHGKVENVSGALEALLILVAAVWIVYEAGRKLYYPEPILAVGWGFAVMAFSAVLNTIVSEYLFRVGRQTESMALEADAWHLRTDVWTSAGVAGGLLIIWGGRAVGSAADLSWLDPVAALLVAVLIARAAVLLTVEAMRDLLDWSLPLQEEAQIREHLHALKPAVHGFHKLRTRKAGAERFMDVHVLVDEDLHVRKAHDISEEIVRTIQEHLPGLSITVHLEPCAGKCDDDCRRGCLLTDVERQQVALRHPHDQETGRWKP
ncbi:MAG: cation diffusion facilitator family transporter [Candidatus Zipacnadales bacterium]